MNKVAITVYPSESLSNVQPGAIKAQQVVDGIIRQRVQQGHKRPFVIIIEEVDNA